MKKQMLLGASFIAVAPSMAQFAAAAPAAPAPAVVPPYNWTGFYGGFAAGYGWGHSHQSDPGTGATGSAGASGPMGPTGPMGPIGATGASGGIGGDGSYSVHGGLAGGTVGYNWQYGPWVIGLEGDYSWANISGSSNACGLNFGLPHNCGTTLESFGTVRGRIGYPLGATGNWLPYVTGGLALGELKAWDSLTPASGSDFRTGWTAGGGVETALTPNWTFKLEYLYFNLGNRQMFDIVPGVPESVSLQGNIVRAGINYKFR
jgi:outer membrane immunogenic protein